MVGKPNSPKVKASKKDRPVLTARHSLKEKSVSVFLI